MQLTLRIFLLICILVYMLVILRMLKNSQLNLRFSLVWMVAGICLLLATCFPSVIQDAASLIGIIDDVNLVFVLEGLFVLCILLSVSGIVSALHNRIRRIVQQLALLEERIRQLEQKEDPR